MDAIWAFEPQVFVATFRGNAANPNPRERTYYTTMSVKAQQ